MSTKAFDHSAGIYGGTGMESGCIVERCASYVGAVISGRKPEMSRSYHVTEKKALKALMLGDSEPGYLASEKHWVKKKTTTARSSKKGVSNRAIVAAEKRRTSAVKKRKGPIYSLSSGFAVARKD
jgi:hypothetical protein